LERCGIHRPRGVSGVRVRIHPHVVTALRAGLTLRQIIPIALVADTLSILIMEVIDNGFMLAVPGAMEAGLDDLLFWATMLGGFAIAWPFAFLVNREMIKRGTGHAVAHQYH
jgi:hypothetical protein